MNDTNARGIGVRSTTTEGRGPEGAEPGSEGTRPDQTPSQPTEPAQPVAFIERKHLKELERCNGMSVWAENPSMYLPMDPIGSPAPGNLVPVYARPVQTEHEMREVFEAWFRVTAGRDLVRWGVSYEDPLAACAWQGWQAALASPPAPAQPSAQAGEVVAPTDELLLKYLGAYLPPSPEPDDITDLRANVMALYAALHAAPIDMVLHCPKCGMQHIDAVEMVEWDRDGGPPANRVTWPNEPHRSHLCHGCGHIWRPADVETNGVAAVKTKGKADSPIVAALPAAPVAVEGVTELERWHKDVYALIGHAEGLKAEGKRDMPAYFYDLAERLARLVGDAPMAERVAALSASLPVQPNED
jgi:hypothetical protein